MKSKLPKKKSYSQAQKEADSALSFYVRGKAGYKCELHALVRKLKLKDFPVKTCNDSLCCFHIFPKFKGGALRYDEKNVICACTGSNYWEKQNRGEWYLWIPKLFPDKYDYLFERRKETIHRKVSDLVYLTMELKQMTEKL